MATTPHKIIPSAETPYRRVDIRAESAALAETAAFLRDCWARVLAVSATLLIPCFWHRRIVSSDLGSHLYNAWLAQLINRGDVSSMSIAHQWTNVLFDLMLSAAGAIVGLHTAERIVVPIVVLVFFWGAFAFVCSATKRAPWFLVPFLALATYGWTFHLGLFNYYLSVGLSFWGIAIFWRGRGWEKLLTLALAPVILLAHPLGLLWLIAACVYIAIAERLPGWAQVLLFLAAAALVDGMRHAILHYYTIQDSLGSFRKYNGADQVVLFSTRYNALKYGVIFAALGMFAVDLARRYRRHLLWQVFAIPLQLYAVIELGVKLLPSGVSISSDLAAVAILTERLTSVAAILAICVLGAMIPSRWHLVITGTLAVVFFAYLYQDTAKINRIELQEEQLVRTLPRDSRVMATIFPLPTSRILIQHTIDRACIGYCFSYGNYEPGTGLFRVRADEGGPYNLGNYELSVQMEQGFYAVQPEDLPVYQVYQCDQTGTKLCITALRAGQENDSMGVYGRKPK